MKMNLISALSLLAVMSLHGAAPSGIAAVRTVPHELDVLVRTGHIQGAACNEEGVFLSHAGGIEQIGWDGRLIRRIDAPSHLGDIAYADGKVYGAFVLRGKAAGRLPGMVRVWNAKLEPLKERRFAEPLDGIVVLNGTVYAGVDRWGRDRHPLCCVKRLDLELNDLGDTDVDLGYEIAYGVQTMATDGKDLFFGNYGGTSRVSPDLKTASKVSLACAEGFGLVPKSVAQRETPVFFTVKALGGNMQGWRKDPTNNPPRIEIRFHEYGNGAFRDVTLPAPAPPPVGEKVTVCLSEAEILVAPEASGTVLFAAKEMQDVLKRMSGLDVPLVRRPTKGRYAFCLGTNAWSVAAGLHPERMKRDSYCVRIGARATCIAGCDDPREDPEKGEGRNRGRWERATLFGVYGFLDRHAGVRFYFPGELGTVVPAADRLTLETGVYSVTPRFPERDCYIDGVGPYLRGWTKGKGYRMKWRYKLLLREATSHVPCCHGQNGFNIAERFSESHPEYFQLRKDGTRCTGTEFEKHWLGRQLCHTSPVWDVFRDETIERIRKGEPCVDIMPQDAMKACWCASCQRVYSTTNFALSSGFASELIWSNTVAVARAITAAGLDGCVSQMAYGPCRSIPNCDIPGNVKVVLPVGGPWAESHPDIRDRQIDFLRKWAEKLGGPAAWTWTYPMKNYGRLQAKDVPQMAPRAYAKFYTLAEPYVDGAFNLSNDGETLVQNYLNFYVFSKFAWDGGIDVEAVLAEHHRLMFGAGASAMAEFFDALEDLWIGRMALPSLINETEIGPYLTGPDEKTIWTEIYTPEVIARLRANLASAAASVKPDSLEARRIAWIRAELFDDMELHSRLFEGRKPGNFGKIQVENE